MNTLRFIYIVCNLTLGASSVALAIYTANPMHGITAAIVFWSCYIVWEMDKIDRGARSSQNEL